VNHHKQGRCCALALPIAKPKFIIVATPSAHPQRLSVPTSRPCSTRPSAELRAPCPISDLHPTLRRSGLLSGQRRTHTDARSALQTTRTQQSSHAAGPPAVNVQRSVALRQWGDVITRSPRSLRDPIHMQSGEDRGHVHVHVAHMSCRPVHMRMYISIYMSMYMSPVPSPTCTWTSIWICIWTCVVLTQPRSGCGGRNTLWG
jgi:hypothetical protein